LAVIDGVRSACTDQHTKQVLSRIVAQLVEHSDDTAVELALGGRPLCLARRAGLIVGARHRPQVKAGTVRWRDTEQLALRGPGERHAEAPDEVGGRSALQQRIREPGRERLDAWTKPLDAPGAERTAEQLADRGVLRRVKVSDRE